MIPSVSYTDGAEVRGLEGAFCLAHVRPWLTADFSNPAASESGSLLLGIANMPAKGYRSGRYMMCELCGEMFYVYPADDRRGRPNRFCSARCYGATKSGSGNPNWRNRTTIEACEICGKQFTFRRSPNTPATWGKYCSVKCMGVTVGNRMRKSLTEEEARSALIALERSPLLLDQFGPVVYGIKGQTLSRLIRKHLPAEWDAVIDNRKAARNKWYKIGRSYEYRVRELLRSRGFIVTRSPRSAGVFDLMACRAGQILLVQCKKSRSFGSARERTGLIIAARTAGATPLLSGPGNKRRITFWEAGVGEGRVGQKRVAYDVN